MACGSAPPSEPGWAETARATLLARESRFGVIEPCAGPLPWRRRPRGFPGLLRGICGQMISQAAAQAIWARLSALPGALEPAGLLALDDAALCGVAGLSRPKAAHARAAARAVLEGRLDLGALSSLPDAEAMARITAIKGLGPWTSGIYLLFAEDRPDILPPGDVALAAAAAHMLTLPSRPGSRQLAALGLAWAPWRSLAARLLWHHWRHATGRTAGEA